jgi:hypothetical protein
LLASARGDPAALGRTTYRHGYWLGWGTAQFTFGFAPT